MTRAGRWLRNLIERLIGRYYEGEEAPRRLVREVRMWRQFNSDATPAEWEAMAIAHAQNAYEQGFVRGYEWAERAWEGPEHDPDVLAKIERDADPDSEPLLPVANELQTPEDWAAVAEDQRAHYFDDVGMQLGTHRVVVVEDPEPE